MLNRIVRMTTAPATVRSQQQPKENVVSARPRAAAFSRFRARSGAGSTLRTAAALAVAAIAAAPLASATVARAPVAAEAEFTVPVTFNVVHIRTGAPLGGWIVEAIHIGPVDPSWSGRTGNNGSVTLNLIEGPYEVLVYRDHPVWITYIEVEITSDDVQVGLVFTIPVDPEQG